MDSLYWYYVQSKKSDDVIGIIINQYKESGHKAKSRIAVIQQLLQQDIISILKCDELMKFEDSLYEREVMQIATPTNTESGIELAEKFEASASPPPDDIKVSSNWPTKEFESFSSYLKPHLTKISHSRYCVIAY